MAGYIGSTQHRHWTFSADELAARKRGTFEAARARLSPNDEAHSGPAASVDPAAPEVGVKRKRNEPSVPPPVSAGSSSAPSPSALEPLREAEEARLLSAYERRILALCDELGFHIGVASTAVIFFKRFFLSHALRDTPPVAVMHTAVFLAIKTEACPYTEVPELSRKLATALALSDADLVGTEAAVLTGLAFQLAVHHPYLPTKALLRQCVKRYAALAADAAAAAGGEVVGATDPLFCRLWDALQDRAFAFARFSLLTDAPLLFAPAEIATAALILAAEPRPLPLSGSGVLTASWRASRGALAAEGGADLDRPPAAVAWCVRGFAMDALLRACTGGEAAAAACKARLESALTVLRVALASPAPDADDEDALLQRLMATLNPEAVPGSRAHALMQQQVALERALGKARKAEARREVERINAAAGHGAAEAVVVED